MRPWLQAVLKIVVMVSTMCSGIRVAKYDVPLGEEEHKGDRGTKQTQQDLGRAA